MTALDRFTISDLCAWINDYTYFCLNTFPVHKITVSHQSRDLYIPVPIREHSIQLYSRQFGNDSDHKWCSIRHIHSDQTLLIEVCFTQFGVQCIFLRKYVISYCWDVNLIWIKVVWWYITASGKLIEGSANNLSSFERRWGIMTKDT